MCSKFFQQINKPFSFNQKLADFRVNSFLKAISTELMSVAIFLITTLIHRFSLLSYIFSRYLGGTQLDAGLYLWLSRIGVDAIDDFSNTKAFYPFGASLAWSDNYLLPSILFNLLPIDSEPLRYNLILLVACFLNGYFTFRLARTLDCDYYGALFSGVSLLTFGYLSQHLGHPQLQWFFWIPFSIEGLILVLRNKIKIGTTIFFISLLGSFFTSVYYSIFIAQIATIIVLIKGSNFIKILIGLKNQPKVSAFLVLLLIILVVPLALAAKEYLQVGKYFGYRNIWEPFSFQAQPSSYLAASDLSYWYRNLSKLSHPEARLFPSITMLLIGITSLIKLSKELYNNYIVIIIIVGIIVLLSFESEVTNQLASLLMWILISSLIYLTQKNKSGIWSLIFIITALFFIYSFGPLTSNPSDGGIISFGRFMHNYFPGASAIRAVSRAGTVTILGLSLMGGWLLTRSRFKLFSIIPILLLCIENYHPIIPIEGETPPPQGLNISHNSRDVIIFLPLVTNLTNDKRIASWSEFSRRNIDAMIWSNKTDWTTVNGYSGQRTFLMEKLPKLVADFPSTQSTLYLRRIVNLKYVFFQHGSNQSMDILLKNSELKLVQNDNVGSLLRLSNVWISGKKLILRFPSYCSGKLKFTLYGNSHQKFNMSKLNVSKVRFNRFNLARRYTVYLTKNYPYVEPSELMIIGKRNSRVGKISFSCNK